MTRLQKLREDARKLHQRLTEAREAAKDDNGDPRLLTDEERTEQEAGLKDLDKYAEDIAAEVRLAIHDGNVSVDPDPATPADGDGEGDETRAIEVGSDLWLQRGFETIGEQLQAIHRHYGNEGHETDRRLYHLNATGGDPELRVASGQSETEPGLGGFMLQKDFQTAIRERSHDQSEDGFPDGHPRTVARPERDPAARQLHPALAEFHRPEVQRDRRGQPGERYQGRRRACLLDGRSGGVHCQHHPHASG